MNHIAILEFKRNQGISLARKSLISRATGSFYTPEVIGLFINKQIIPLLKARSNKIISVVDPFAGDGRLICWLIERAQQEGINALWKISLWEQSEEAISEAKERINAMQRHTGVAIELSVVCTNSFDYASGYANQFDLVITNPPWEALKPDRRELEELSEVDCNAYIAHMKSLDQHLTKMYPHSQPTKKFAGWGTNLSRVGLELSIKLLKPNGQIAIVLPSSTFADQVSVPLRRWVVENTTIESVGYFPAEARLFKHVDQASMVLIGVRKQTEVQRFSLCPFDYNSSSYGLQQFVFSLDAWRANDFCIPFAIHGNAQGFLDSISSLPTWAELENLSHHFWAGRELDETGLEAKLSSNGKYRFIKGRMVGRFQFMESATKRIAIKNIRVPRTADMHRIAWRDVSRPTQRRRMQATMIEPGFVTGNSLNVALFENQDEQAALALLAVVNSLVFEVQVRARSSTSHISLGVVRGVRIPDIQNRIISRQLSSVAMHCLKKPGHHETALEVAVAKAYGLSKKTLISLLPSFPGISSEEVNGILDSPAW